MTETSTTSSADPSSRPLGTITVREERCSTENADARCLRARITCPQLPDAEARVRIRGAGDAGTIILPTGEESTRFFGDTRSPDIATMLAAYHEVGLRTVEVEWRGNGIWDLPAAADEEIGSITLACRFATLASWVADNEHDAGPYIGQGNSAGGTQLAASLMYYGGAAWFDRIIVSAGPVPCPLAIDGDLNMDGQGTCARERLLSDDPARAYPATSVHVLIGDGEPNAALRDMAAAFHAAIQTEKTFTTVPDTKHQVPGSPNGSRAIMDLVLAGLE